MVEEYRKRDLDAAIHTQETLVTLDPTFPSTKYILASGFREAVRAELRSHKARDEFIDNAILCLTIIIGATDRIAREKGYDLDDFTKELGAKKGLRELAHDLQDDPRLLRETADTYYFFVTTSRKLFAAKQQPYQPQSIQSITSPFYLEPLYVDEGRVAGYSVRAALPAKNQINTFFNKDDPNNGADYVQALSKETDQTFGIHFSKTKNVYVVQIVEADMNVDPYGKSFTLEDAIEILRTLQAKGFATTLRDHPRPPNAGNEHTYDR